MIKTYLSLLLCFFVVSAACAQKMDTQKLDLYFKSLEESGKFMGSVAISENGKIIYTKSLGFSDVEANTKTTENSKYRIGSISKTFTTVLVLKAVEEKKLDLNQTIEKFFPTIQHADKITIKYLLGHRSGIHNFTDDESYPSWLTEAKTEKEMVEIIAKGGSDFAPGMKAEYSNSNFVLLSYILEKTFNKPYAEILKIYIADPIGLTNTYLGGKIDTKNNEVKSYHFAGGWQPETETDISIPLGAGGIVSTPKDLTKFSDGLFGGKLLKKESLELMKTLKDGYGLGLFQTPFVDKIGYGHTGGIDGFSSEFIHFADKKVSFALISNGSNYNNSAIMIAMQSAFYNKPYDIPVFTSYEVKPEDLDQYAGVYSSTQIPVKITILKEGKILTAQATGQAAFPLEASAKDKFVFDQAGIVMEFNLSEKTMVL
ncbi:serine hydrolase domain-containing protein, partial [Fluviicola sp.]|uniref:serine hydrolase domain-containing protein n=1 Tax=Fluviicola sp. TaxID=1917219 RepID=UPI002637947B